MKFLALFSLVIGLLASPVYATVAAIPGILVPPGPQAQFAIDRFMGPVALAHRLGYRMLEAHTTASGRYDFSLQGGAIGSYDSGIHLPKGALIREVVFDVVTAGTTSASGTLSFDANSTGDLKAALAAASWTGIVAGIPVYTAASMVKLTAARTLTFSIATGALTAGKVNVYVDYAYPIIP